MDVYNDDNDDFKVNSEVYPKSRVGKITSLETPVLGFQMVAGSKPC
jgi:hypothetical protein